MTFVTSSKPVATLQVADSAKPTATEPTFLEFRTVLAAQYEQWRALPLEEKSRHAYLEKHGLSEIDLDNLSGQDRAAHEEKIASLAKPLVFSTYPFSGSKGGDAMSRAVITLQSVLDTFDTDPARSKARTAPVGQD